MTKLATGIIAALIVIAAAIVVALTVTIEHGFADSHDELQSDDPVVGLRVAAQRLDDGRTEFALHAEHDNGRLLPNTRMFPSEGGESWLYSSRINISLLGDVRTGLDIPTQPVRIAARRLPSGSLEFGVQALIAEDMLRTKWSNILLPSSRFFPGSAEAGRWLRSSQVNLFDAEEPTITVPAGVPMNVPDSVTLEWAELDGYTYSQEPSFYYGTDTDPITDHVRTWVNKVAATDDRLYDTLKLQVTCDSDGSVNAILWENSLPFVSGDYVTVVWRIDQGVPITERWYAYSSSNDGLYPSDEFAFRLRNASVATVRVQYHSRTLTATFTNVRAMFQTRVQPNLRYCGDY